MNRVEIYIITKEEGSCLLKYDIIGSEETAKDQLISGFLTGLNNFAKEIGFPSGVSLIRSGSLEARFSVGKHIFSVLIIDYNMPLGLESEPILSGMANEITQSFETKYFKELEESAKDHIFDGNKFQGFRTDIDEIINRYGSETHELYQKLILIEALYAKVPQKWCVPKIEQVSNGKDISEELFNIPEMYHKQLRQAIEKVNYAGNPVWRIFAIPML